MAESVLPPTADDERFMRLALDLARRGEGRTCPNPAVGAVIVQDGEVVGQGFHPAAGEPHAEIFALRAAGGAARGATLYVTLEPCCHSGRTGPCSTALINAGIVRVVAGTRDPNPKVDGGGFAQLQRAGVQVESGVLGDECQRLIAPFAKHVTTGLPFVTLKAGMTLEGAVATVAGESQWITGVASRLQAHRLRDRHDAIMVGIGTVLADNPQLTTRLPEGGGKNPLRIVIDSQLRTPADAALISAPGSTLIVTTQAASPIAEGRLRDVGAMVLRVAPAPGGVDLPAAMQALGAQGIQSILLEGGGRLNHAALHAGIVDRICAFFAPLLFGGSGMPLFAGVGVEHLSQAYRLRNLRSERFGDDILIEGEIETSCSPA